MNNSIHIEVQMVKFWQQRRIGDNLIDFRVTFTDPSVKLARGKRDDVSADSAFDLVHYGESIHRRSPFVPLGHPS
jgi:hypothetical protein